MLTGYAAFLDVLGFSSMVATEHHSERIDAYLNCLNRIFDKEDGSKIDYVVFSDSIVITTRNDDEESLLALLSRCSTFFGALIASEIAVRGAIAHGSYLTSKTATGTFVAGRAIIEAYTFEQRQDWVGIMLAPSVNARVPDLTERCLIEDPYQP
jgi:hypothetical protein